MKQIVHPKIIANNKFLKLLIALDIVVDRLTFEDVPEIKKIHANHAKKLWLKLIPYYN